jgi:hypothetical protein
MADSGYFRLNAPDAVLEHKARRLVLIQKSSSVGKAVSHPYSDSTYVHQMNPLANKFDFPPFLKSENNQTIQLLGHCCRICATGVYTRLRAAERNCPADRNSDELI